MASSNALAAAMGDIRRELSFVRSGSLWARAYTLVFSPSLHILYLYRVSSGVHGLLAPHPLLWRIFRIPFELIYRPLRWFFMTLKGVEIPYQTQIGAGLRLVHPYNIILTPQTQIGENCTIFNGVTCGVNHLDRSGYPRIGNAVVLYPGCKVIGNVSLGDTVLIGPNAVVIRDVPSHSVAVGVPAVVKGSIESLDLLQW